MSGLVSFVVAEVILGSLGGVFVLPQSGITWFLYWWMFGSVASAAVIYLEMKSMETWIGGCECEIFLRFMIFMTCALMAGTVMTITGVVMVCRVGSWVSWLWIGTGIVSFYSIPAMVRARV